MPDDDAMRRRQAVLAQFGDLALRSEDLDEILTEACRLVAGALGTGRAKILEIQHDEGTLLVRAGVGWKPGIVGRLRLLMGERSSETYAIEAGEPVIMRDVRTEGRFVIPEFMKEAGVIALANVPVFLPGHRAFGLLQVDSTEPRDFDEEDTEFLRTYATILGPVIDRLLKLRDLRAVEERFRLTVGTALDYAIFLADAGNRITDWLPGAAAVFGWTAEEIVGLPADVLFTGEDRDAGEPRREIETALAEGVAPDVRWHLRRDGSRVFIEGSTRALRDPDGALRGFLKIGQDVTRRRASDEQLRVSEARLLGFAEASTDVFWIADARGKRLDYLSPAFERLYGMPREAAMADLSVVLDRVHPDDRAAFLSGMPRALAGETAIVHYRAVRPDGSVLYLRDTGFPVRDEAGGIAQIAGVVQDISDMEAARGTLEEEKERFRTLVEGIPQLVWRSCDEGLWTWASRQWCDYTGQSEDESRGVGWRRALHPDDRERAVAAWHEARPHGRLYVEYRVRRAADGAYRWHQTRSVPVRDGPTPEEPEGRIIEWLGTTTDIEDLKRLQGQQSVLLAELQHRTRNLLAVVRTVARRSFGSLPERDEYDARLAALGRVQAFLSGATSWSVPLRDLVEAELRAVGDGHSVQATVSGPSVDLPGDKVQTFALALHELATNAAKYGALSQDDAHLVVAWHVSADGGAGRRLVLDWRESGVSMPEGGPTRRGYGSELIERALPYQLGAETNRVFTPDGLRCTIALPIGAFREGEDVP